MEADEAWFYKTCRLSPYIIRKLKDKLSYPLEHA